MTLLHENSIYNSLILFKHNILRILINLKKKKNVQENILPCLLEFEHILRNRKRKNP